MKQIYIVQNKEAFIRQLKPLTNAKIMTLSELESKVFGTYGNEARAYLYLNKHIGLNMIDVYLTNLKYVDDNPINDKIQYLIDLKKELSTTKGINGEYLYYKDELFLTSLSNYEITFYNFINNKHIEKLVNELRKHCKVNFIELEAKSVSQEVHEYRYLDDEVNSVVYQIMNLLSKGKKLNNIKLMNVDNAYYASLERVLNQYHIPHLAFYETSLAATNYGINFIKNMNELGVKEALTLLTNTDYDNLILNVVNNYAFLDHIDDAKELIIEDLKHKHVNDLKRDVYLELVDLNYEKQPDDYIFFMNLNNGVAPKISEDNDYISDIEYRALNELTSDDKTNISEKTLLHILSNVDYISYKLVGAFDAYLPSYIISKYKLNVIKEKNIKHLTYYSDEFETYNYALSRDHYYKTKIKDDNYDFLKYNFESNVIDKNYAFTGIDVSKFHDFIDHKLSLSYSKLNDYFNCHYAYYLKHILRINNFENTLPTIRGNVFHKLLERKDDADFNYDEVFEKEINSFKETDNKIHFFTSLIKDEFILAKEFNENLIDSSSLNEHLEEYAVNINKQIKDINISIVGYIDKVLFNEKACMLIDYKSGSIATFHLDLLYYGLDLQLPMYAYYMKHDPNFKDKKIAGLYLEYIYHAFNKKTLLDKVACMKEFKLKGYTNDLFMDLLSDDFPTYFVKSNKLTNHTVDNMISFTETKVDEAINDIIDAKFDVNPSYMKGRHDSCQFCEFHDICHFKDKKRILDVKEVSDFLGGE